MGMTIERWRGRIDSLDHELLELLNQRALLALEVGRTKRAAGLGLRDRRREEAILSRARERNAGPLSAAAVERLFRAIIAECLGAESHRVEARRLAKPRLNGRRACA